MFYRVLSQARVNPELSEKGNFYSFLGHTQKFQGFFMVVHSGIIPGHASGTMWDAGEGTKIRCVEVKHPICLYSSGSGKKEFFIGK